MAELVLPLKEKNFTSEMADTLSDMHNNLEKYLSNFAKVYLPAAKEAIKDTKYTKMAHKMIEQAFKAKWILNALKSLKSIASNTLAAAGDWIMKIIKFLLIMTIIDPKGKLLASLLNMFAGIFIWLVEAIAKQIPVLVKLFITLVTKILPNVFIKIVTAVFQALKNMFKELAKSFPALAPLFSIMSSIFAKGSPFHYFFTKILPKVIPILVTAFVIMGIAAKLAPAFAILKTVITLLLSPIKFLAMGLFQLLMFIPGVNVAIMKLGMAFKMGGITGGIKQLAIGVKALTMSVYGAIKGLVLQAIANWAVLGPILLVVLAIGAVIAVFILIWKYSDKIVKFFEGAFKKFTNWFKKASIPMKILAVILVIILSPLIAIAGIVYGIAKFAQLVKKIGWEGVWKLIKDGFFKWVNSIGEGFKSLGEGIKGWVGKTWEGFKETGARLKSWGKSIKETTVGWADSMGGFIGKFFAKHFGPFMKKLAPIFVKLAPVFAKIKEVLSTIWDLIKSVILATVQKIKSGFNMVRDFFAVLQYRGWDFIFGKEEERRGLLKSAQILREADRDVEAVLTQKQDIVKGQKLTSEAATLIGRRDKVKIVKTIGDIQISITSQNAKKG